MLHYYASEITIAAALSTTLLAIKSDCHAHNHVNLNNVHCLEKSHFYYCMCLTTWKMDLPKSLAALLRNLSKVLSDGSKSLQAAKKRDYNDEDKFVHTSTHSYYVTHICTAHECLSTCVPRRCI